MLFCLTTILVGNAEASGSLQHLHSSHSRARVLMVTAGMSDRITMDVLHSSGAGMILKRRQPGWTDRGGFEQSAQRGDMAGWEILL